MEIVKINKDIDKRIKENCNIVVVSFEMSNFSRKSLLSLTKNYSIEN